MQILWEKERPINFSNANVLSLESSKILKEKEKNDPCKSR